MKELVDLGLLPERGLNPQLVANSSTLFTTWTPIDRPLTLLGSVYQFRHPATTLL